MISIKNAWKSFGEKVVLRDLSLEVSEGETLVILGRSGCGKSVLLRILLGLEPLDRGEVYIRGKNLSELRKVEKIAFLKQMGMLFQSGALFDSLSVGENVAFYFTYHNVENGKKISREELDKRVSYSLKRVGLEGMEQMSTAELSGGMRRRVGLARLLCQSPDIFLYDEPTTGLDPITAEQIDAVISSIRDKVTSIVVTHHLASALRIADRIALHAEGKILCVDEKKKFIESAHPQVQQFFTSERIE